MATAPRPSRVTLKAIRFGYGLPGPMRQAVQAEAPGQDVVADIVSTYRQMQRSDGMDEDARRKLRRQLPQTLGRQAQVTIARAVSPEDDAFERFANFWTDHFTVSLQGFENALFVQPFVDNAIRPNVYGRFADMLKAAVTHPAMLLYLDQPQSMGDNSFVGKLRPKRGLNENLAREVLELHTLGVGAPYTQTDVRELAELFTGLSMSRAKLEFQFRPSLSEPGPEVVLGKEYGGAHVAALDEILKALEDLAKHKATSEHLARKLAVHFVSDAPSEALVDELARVYRQNDTQLRPVYDALRAHPETERAFGAKAKQPLDFVVSGLRALGISGQDVLQADLRQFRDVVLDPLRRMGQPFRQPNGPDGWPEDLGAWITPAALSERVFWAMNVQTAIGLNDLDPMDVLERALGEVASDQLRWAAPKAETRAQGVALVLASPEFNRR